MKAPRRLAPCLLALLAGTLLFAACGGSDTKSSSTSLDAYFQQLHAVGNEFLAALNARAQTDPSAPVGEQVSAYQEFARTLTGKIQGAKDKLASLQPPPEVKDAHTELVSAVSNALAVTQQIAGELAQVQSVHDLRAVAAKPDVLAAFEHFRTSCAKLQQLATHNKVTVDLNCEGAAAVP